MREGGCQEEAEARRRRKGRGNDSAPKSVLRRGRWRLVESTGEEKGNVTRVQGREDAKRRQELGGRGEAEEVTPHQRAWQGEEGGDAHRVQRR